MDAGIKIAVENHAGDLHSRELVELIEKAGPEFVGATIDTGNSTWTLEDPVETFRNLADHAVCSGIRDSMVWRSEKGAKVQWTAMGDGCVDLKTLFKEWSEQCPETPVQIETISGFAREFPYLEKEFWPPYSTIRADDYSRFLALSRKGKAMLPFSVVDGEDPQKAKQNYQLKELEKVWLTAGNIWEWAESPLRHHPANPCHPNGQHHPSLPIPTPYPFGSDD